jgi:hypothetical protein
MLLGTAGWEVQGVSLSWLWSFLLGASAVVASYICSERIFISVIFGIGSCNICVVASDQGIYGSVIISFRIHHPSKTFLAGLSSTRIKKYSFCGIKSLAHLKNFKNGPVPYLGLELTIHAFKSQS